MRLLVARMLLLARDRVEDSRRALVPEHALGVAEIR
jgi:hypothetical protein